ncbi:MULTISPECIES: sensor histidine kinase [unclassified Cellulophaga]|uniref:sensor histidine kinase n=1 Tax=unclassified Cellulophaga TaxID=2634405 RepID=UPI0026E29283|nr:MULTISPECIES: histidine kinase [unclassified Cellulophaga]MDO6492483.1 histidine kinase [Cellulophaga sp. 2_MG-2023]MDO6493585.1 histidine kinase [Cellulophaga sp. 3_MG-2023]
MNATIRFIFQSILWLVLWFILWSQQGYDTIFLERNSFSAIGQIILIALLIYYTAPKFLFTKKHFKFVCISIIALTIFIIIPSTLLPLDQAQHIPRMPQIRNVNRPLPMPPSRHLTQVLLLLIAYILATVVEFVVYTKKKEEEIIISKNENLETELKLLKSQINPHFLFNALNNIYALSAIDTAKTQQSISYLSTMLRYVLYECERPFVLLSKEVEYIENYIKLFTLKSSKKYPITMTFNTLDNNIQIAPMLLIPFVENAIKHSNIEQRKDTFITINLSADKENINFKVENSIADKDILKDEVGGIGLDNVKKRLEILYPNKHTLSISKTSGIFKVELNLQKNV